MKTELINQNVTVTAVRFDKSFEPIPRRIEFGGRSINLIDEGIRLHIKSGGATTRMFDMSDGRARFRLRRAPDNQSWHLVSISN